MLTMSRDEARAFGCINSSQHTLTKHCKNGVGRFTAERLFSPPMASVLKSGQHQALMESVGGPKKINRYIPEKLTKVVALRKDLAKHRREEPGLRAVVYTQHLDVHAACVRGLEKDGFEIYQFTGSSSSTNRDKGKSLPRYRARPLAFVRPHMLRDVPCC